MLVEGAPISEIDVFVTTLHKHIFSTEVSRVGLLWHWLNSEPPLASSQGRTHSTYTQHRKTRPSHEVLPVDLICMTCILWLRNRRLSAAHPLLHWGPYLYNITLGPNHSSSRCSLSTVQSTLFSSAKSGLVFAPLLLEVISYFWMKGWCYGGASLLRDSRS